MTGMDGMSHGGAKPEGGKTAPSGAMGGGIGGMGGGMGGLSDFFLGSSMTQPLLKMAVGYFPKMGLLKTVELRATSKKAGAKKAELWFGPFDIATVAVS
jgi:hypothetical protein